MNGYELIAEFERVVKDCIFVPNEKLPENFRDNRTDCVSLADLEKKYSNIIATESDYQIEKQDKDKRIAIYAKMVENEQELEYLPK